MSEKRVRREGSPRFGTREGGELTFGRGRVAGGDDAVGGETSAKEHRPGGGRYPCMLQRGLRQRVVTLPLLVLLASDGLGRGRQIGHFVSTPPHRENGSSHTPPHRTEPSMSSLCLCLCLSSAASQAGLFGLHSPLGFCCTRRRCASPASRCGSARTSSPRTDLHRARLHQTDSSRSHGSPPPYDPWPPGLSAKHSIFRRQRKE